MPRTPQRCSDSGGNPPRKTQLNKPNQRRKRIKEEESKNMRAAKTDKFGFHQNPSFSEIGVSDLYTSKQFSGSEIAVYRRHRPQKKQDNRSKRPARLGRDKYQSSPGFPFFLRVSQLSEREPSGCGRSTILQSGAVRVGKQDLSAVFSVPPTHPTVKEEDSRPVPRTPQRGLRRKPPLEKLSSISQTKTKEESKNMRAAKTDKRLITRWCSSSSSLPQRTTAAAVSAICLG